MSVVLDASAAASWILPDESGAESLLSVPRRRYVVPAVFACEIVYVLGRARQQGRITETQIRSGLDDLSALDIETAPDPGFAAIFNATVSHGVFAYDAAYLLLALERGLPLATLDAKLADVARAAGIAVVP